MTDSKNTITDFFNESTNLVVFDNDNKHLFFKGDEKFETGLKKFGAILGDNVEVGCNSVLNPGTVIGNNSNIYPLSCVRGTVPANSIYKTGGIIVDKQ